MTKRILEQQVQGKIGGIIQRPGFIHPELMHEAHIHEYIGFLHSMPEKSAESVFGKLKTGPGGGSVFFGCPKPFISANKEIPFFAV